jgi:hypothetical protein
MRTRRSLVDRNGRAVVCKRQSSIAGDGEQRHVPRGQRRPASRDVHRGSADATMATKESEEAEVLRPLGCDGHAGIARRADAAVRRQREQLGAPAPATFERGVHTHAPKAAVVGACDHHRGSPGIHSDRDLALRPRCRREVNSRTGPEQDVRAPVERCGRTTAAATTAATATARRAVRPRTRARPPVLEPGGSVSGHAPARASTSTRPGERRRSR